MRVVVTGGAGFIGSHLVDRLLDVGYEVVIVDNFCTGAFNNIKDPSKLVSIIDHDIRNPLPISIFDGASIVFHLAALADIVPSIENPVDYMSTNVQGTVNVLESARKCNVKRVIYTASSTCYGLPIRFPTTENDQIEPTFPYALSKYLGELVFFHWLNLYGLKGLSLRLFNVYGPRSRTSGNYGAVMGVFLAQKIAKLPFTIVGDGTQVRDFTHVTDVAEAFVLAGESEITGEAINIGTQQPQSINRLAELLGGDIEYIQKRPGEPDITHAEISKAKNLLKWKPKISFEEGVKDVLNHINLWKDAPLWDKENIEKATSAWFQYLGKNETQ